MTRCLMLLLVFSCTYKRSIEKKHLYGFDVEAQFINDSIIHGEARYFKNGFLYKKASFHYGDKQGLEVNYHSNGKVYDSAYYQDNFLDGYKYTFDSLGRLGYKEFFSRGFEVGPRTKYVGSIATDYYFMAYDKRPIFIAKYDNSGNLINYEGEFNNVITYGSSSDSLGIFIYLIEPPGLSIRYSYVLKNSSNKKEQSIPITAERVLFDTVVSNRNKDEVHVIRAFVTDKNVGSSRVYETELMFSFPDESPQRKPTNRGNAERNSSKHIL